MAALTGWSIEDYGSSSSASFADTSSTSGTISGYGGQIPFTSFADLEISAMARAVTGEFDLSMRVGELQEDSGGNAGSPTSDLFVGLGFTTDLDADTAFVLAYTRNEPPGTSHLERKTRRLSKAGAALQETQSDESGYYAGGEYLRITRDSSGNITTYVSDNGTTWTELGDTSTTATQITGSGYMIIWASDGNNTTGAKALVDNISDSTASGDEVTGDSLLSPSYIGTATIGQNHTVAGNGISSPSYIGTATIGQNHQVSGESLVSPSFVGDATIGQNHTVTGEGLVSPSYIGQASIGQNHVLSGEGLVSPSYIGTATIGQTDTVQGSGLLSPSYIGTATIIQNHVVSAGGLLSPSYIGTATVINEADYILISAKSLISNSEIPVKSVISAEEVNVKSTLP
ncbi:MAG: hypothetical protein HRU40_08355 [Saprospiraceae bacterium]|nr:hypothetical protein [Saprospiraceae bacterium]